MISSTVQEENFIIFFGLTKYANRSKTTKCISKTMLIKVTKS